MTGIDHLFAKALDGIIRKELGNKTVKKIEKRLFEKYGISFQQSIEQFDKLDVVLREFFGRGTDGIERKFCEKLFEIKSKKSKEKWFTLSDNFVNSSILNTYGDPEKMKIIESVNDSPKTTAEILKKCKLARTSGYRKINSLIDDGLLYISDQIIVDNKRINKYACVFTNLRINISNNKVTVDVQLNNSDISKSSILQTVQ